MFLLCALHAQLLSPAGLCDPMYYSLPGSSVHGIFQARILERIAISSSRGSSQPRDWTCVSCVPCVGRWILYHWDTWEAALSRSIVFQLPSKQHSIVTYSHHIACYIPRTYSSCNWKFVPFVHLQFLTKVPVSVSPTTRIKQDPDPEE